MEEIDYCMEWKWNFIKKKTEPAHIVEMYYIPIKYILSEWQLDDKDIERERAMRDGIVSCYSHRVERMGIMGIYWYKNG